MAPQGMLSAGEAVEEKAEQEEAKQYKNSLAQLVEDLQSEEKKTFCILSNYFDVSLQDLNQYLKKEGPIFNKHFGHTSHFIVENKRLIPVRMVIFGHERVAFKIASELGMWIKTHPLFGGIGTTSQGAFVLDAYENETLVRMPDVAYTPRNITRSLSHSQTWTYQGEPFAPTFVVEVDTLVGRNSQKSFLDRKMREEYFQHGILLGWLIDPKNKIMIEYILENGNVVCTRDAHGHADQSWRNLSGRDVLPGFIIKAITLDKLENQDPGSSDEEELELRCNYPNCSHVSSTLSENAAHAEWHRDEASDRRYLQRINRLG